MTDLHPITGAPIGEVQQFVVPAKTAAAPLIFANEISVLGFGEMVILEFKAIMPDITAEQGNSGLANVTVKDSHMVPPHARIALPVQAFLAFRDSLANGTMANAG
jgi:hypothetical protein